MQVGAAGAAVGIDKKACAIHLARKNYARLANDTGLAWPSTPHGPANVIFERHDCFMPSRKHQVCGLDSTLYYHDILHLLKPTAFHQDAHKHTQQQGQAIACFEVPFFMAGDVANVVSIPFLRLGFSNWHDLRLDWAAAGVGLMML